MYLSFTNLILFLGPRSHLVSYLSQQYFPSCPFRYSPILPTRNSSLSRLFMTLLPSGYPDLLDSSSVLSVTSTLTSRIVFGLLFAPLYVFKSLKDLSLTVVFLVFVVSAHTSTSVPESRLSGRDWYFPGGTSTQSQGGRALKNTLPTSPSSKSKSRGCEKTRLSLEAQGSLVSSPPRTG